MAPTCASGQPMTRSPNQHGPSAGTTASHIVLVVLLLLAAAPQAAKAVPGAFYFEFEVQPLFGYPTPSDKLFQQSTARDFLASFLGEELMGWQLSGPLLHLSILRDNDFVGNYRVWQSLLRDKTWPANLFITNADGVVYGMMLHFPILFSNPGNTVLSCPSRNKVGELDSLTVDDTSHPSVSFHFQAQAQNLDALKCISLQGSFDASDCVVFDDCVSIAIEYEFSPQVCTANAAEGYSCGTDGCKCKDLSHPNGKPADIDTDGTGSNDSKSFFASTAGVGVAVAVAVAAIALAAGLTVVRRHRGVRSTISVSAGPARDCSLSDNDNDEASEITGLLVNYRTGELPAVQAAVGTACEMMAGRPSLTREHYVGAAVAILDHAVNRVSQQQTYFNEETGDFPLMPMPSSRALPTTPPALSPSLASAASASPSSSDDLIELGDVSELHFAASSSNDLGSSAASSILSSQDLSGASTFSSFHEHSDSQNVTMHNPCHDIPAWLLASGKSPMQPPLQGFPSWSSTLQPTASAMSPHSMALSSPSATTPLSSALSPSSEGTLLTQASPIGAVGPAWAFGADSDTPNPALGEAPPAEKCPLCQEQPARISQNRPNFCKFCYNRVYNEKRAYFKKRGLDGRTPEAELDLFIQFLTQSTHTCERTFDNSTCNRCVALRACADQPHAVMRILRTHTRHRT
eukprot:m.16169 g.16169  ORF g.16169 m.16169 type:complete len:689 (-) comp3481_c0_seq1:1481-3547(-)